MAYVLHTHRISHSPQIEHFNYFIIRSIQLLTHACIGLWSYMSARKGLFPGDTYKHFDGRFPVPVIELAAHNASLPIAIVPAVVALVTLSIGWVFTGIGSRVMRELCVVQRYKS